MIRAISNSDWNPIVTAPTDAELELCVHEGVATDLRRVARVGQPLFAADPDVAVSAAGS